MASALFPTLLCPGLFLASPSQVPRGAQAWLGCSPVDALAPPASGRPLEVRAVGVRSPGALSAPAELGCRVPLWQWEEGLEPLAWLGWPGL